MDIIERVTLPSRDGFDIELVITPDLDSTPYDADCYSPDDIAAWRNDDWSYVGIVVTASRAGVELGDASIWATEHGDIAGTHVDAADITTGATEYYLADLTNEAVDNARRTLSAINAA